MSEKIELDKSTNKICLALDLHDEAEILAAVDELKDLVGYFKLNSAFTLYGPSLVNKILSTGSKVFLDLKLHDIPNTLSGYGDAVARLGVHLVTVHVAGGKSMLQEFVRTSTSTAKRLGVPRPKLVGISLLTSISQDMMNKEMNVLGSIDDEVLRRALLAAEAGLDGIVCSANELQYIRPHLPRSFFYVTPGVRPMGSSNDDHMRTASYSQAIKAGSGLLVVGRTVLAAKDPREALRGIHLEIASQG